MCFFKRKSAPVIDENRFYLKVVSNGFYIELFGADDPKNQISMGEGEHHVSTARFEEIKKTMHEHLDELMVIYKKQTQPYLAEHKLEGYANKHITLKMGPTSIKVDAAIDDQTDRSTICNIIERLKHMID